MAQKASSEANALSSPSAAASVIAAQSSPLSPAALRGLWHSPSPDGQHRCQTAADAHENKVIKWPRASHESPVHLSATVHPYPVPEQSQNRPLNVPGNGRPHGPGGRTNVWGGDECPSGASDGELGNPDRWQ
jgi:hypothetical protein